MSDYQFMKYEPCQGEKYLGIATIKLYGRIILRYKIVGTKDGLGYFPAAASYKQPGQGDQYYSAFLVDSNSEKEEIENIVKHGAKMHMQSLGLDIYGNPSTHATDMSGQPHGAFGNVQPRPDPFAGNSDPFGVARPASQPYPNNVNYPQQRPAQQALPGFSNPPPMPPSFDEANVPF